MDVENLFFSYAKIKTPPRHEADHDWHIYLSQENLFNFLRNIIMKLVVISERIHLFKTGEIRAREQNLDIDLTHIEDRL